MIPVRERPDLGLGGAPRGESRWTRLLPFGQKGLNGIMKRTALIAMLALATAAAGLCADNSPITLSSTVRGRSAEPGKTVEYAVTVANRSEQPQSVALSVEQAPWAAMKAAVAPTRVELAAGETARVVMRVSVPEGIPPGGNEPQTLRAAPGGTLKFITARSLPHPNILFTKEGWDAIRAKCDKYEWAGQQRNDTVARAERWTVPGVRNPNNPQRGDWLFATQTETDFMAAGIAYQLTGERKYAEKVRTFLLRLSDPKNGFPVTRRACNQASVQEGHYFQHIAETYDLVLPSGVFTEADRAQIAETLHLFIGEERDLGSDNISNWCVSWNGGALMCALVVQDLGAADWVLNTPGGVLDQFRRGTLDDGWWYECSISYNVWCATMFTQYALALRPWGYNLIDMQLPSNYGPAPDQVTPPEREEYGMSKARWGPVHRNSIGIKRMWDALPPMLDYRGMMFGLNDSTMNRVGGAAMDIAYYAYRDAAYADVIRRGGSRDLLYGLPELPEGGPDRSRSSAFADNAGVVLLRSQAGNRPQSEQIQAVLHYGDHGWYHGHFDRTNLLHLSRYGRSFYNPEMIWYGYASYLYKFYVQTSVSKNMVVVDQKMQEPTASHRLLFHTGKLMQAAAVETRSRWSNPPYGGIKYDESFTSFSQQMEREARSLPVPQNPPPYGKFGSVTGYTEPVLQRRLLVVTDDYIVLADYLKADSEHTFDSLLQMKGFQGIANARLVRHTGQWNPDPVGSAQFVTDCDWYQAAAPSVGRYEFRFGPGSDNGGTRADDSTDGVLKFQVHTLWPLEHEIMVGTPPENHGGNRRVDYVVRGDGRTLAEGRSGVWILGCVDLDVPVEGVKTLELETRTSAAKPATLFWGGGRIRLADGQDVPLARMPISFDHAAQPKEAGKDFEGGPVKIAGIAYADAVSAQPQEGGKPSIARVDLSGLKAVRFKGVLGGDFPRGDETQRRKTVAVRTVGTQARFLTLIEPYEEKTVVKSATASGPDTLRVELVDGRTQEIAIRNMEGTGRDLRVEIRELRGSAVTATETAP